MASLVDIGRRQFVSVRALAGVLQDIKEHGLPSAVSRSSIKRARDSEFAEYNTAYGPIIRSIEIGVDAKGNPCNFWYADSRASLVYFISESEKLARFFKNKLLEKPCDLVNPWHIIIYNDEITPGNQMLRHNNRKTQTFYYSFLEFESDALSSEFLWFTLTVARSDEVNEITGWSFGTFSKHLMVLFEVWRTEGFVCGDIIIFAELFMLVCDENALKATLDVKGASGKLPCFKCKNVMSKKSFRKLRRKRGRVCIWELNWNKFDLHDDISIIANAEYLRDQKLVLGPGKFKALQTSLGLNYNPDGVLLSNMSFSTRVVSGSCFDPQHVYLVHGVFNIECGLLLKTLKKGAGIKAADIGTFFNTFSWPSNSRTGASMFDNRSEKDLKKIGEPITCSASDILGSYALLQEFLMLRVWGTATADVKAACASYFALCNVLTLMTSVPRGGVTSAMLMAEIVKHLNLHAAAYGKRHWVPKFHCTMHIPDQLDEMGLIVFCFTHERKHKEIKRYLQGRCDTSAPTYEKNILQDVMHMQKLALREDIPYPCGTCLLSPRPQVRSNISVFLKSYYPACKDFKSSVDAKVNNHTTCHINDVVYLMWEDNSMATGQVLLLVSVDNDCKACVRTWTKLPQRNMYTTKGSVFLVPLEDIVDTCVYRISNEVAYVVPPRGAEHACQRNP